MTLALCYGPPNYVCRRIVRRRYVRRDEPYSLPVIAELPMTLERCTAGPGLLAAILTAEYYTLSGRSLPRMYNAQFISAAIL